MGMPDTKLPRPFTRNGGCRWRRRNKFIRRMIEMINIPKAKIGIVAVSRD